MAGKEVAEHVAGEKRRRWGMEELAEKKAAKQVAKERRGEWYSVVGKCCQEMEPGSHSWPTEGVELAVHPNRRMPGRDLGRKPRQGC